jgi:hypothetical protein
MNGFIVLGSFLFLMGWKPGADSVPYLMQNVDRKAATIGDRMHFTVEIFTADDEQVALPENVPMLGRLNVKQRDVVEKIRGGEKRTTVEYELVSYQVGRDTIPAMEFRILRAGDSTVVVTEAEGIEIKSIAPNMTGQEDIRGLRKQRGMRIPTWQYLLLLGCGGLIIAALLLFAWKRGRKRFPEKVKSRPPWEEALEALERLTQQAVSSPEEIKRFYTLLSYIMRNYYEQRFLFPAVEFTTTEIMRKIRKIKALRQFVEATGDLLIRSDMVKFAKHLPETVDRGSEIGLVKRIVECTTEKEEEGAMEETHV